MHCRKQVVPVLPLELRRLPVSKSHASGHEHLRQCSLHWFLEQHDQLGSMYQRYDAGRHVGIEETKGVMSPRR